MVLPLPWGEGWSEGEECGRSSVAVGTGRGRSAPHMPATKMSKRQSAEFISHWAAMLHKKRNKFRAPEKSQMRASPSMKRICIIFNPAAKGERARRFRRHLNAMGAESDFKPTSGPGQGRSLAAAALRAGYETIVAAGGDGTVNEVINGIGDVPHGFDQVRLGILPLGTVNVFAKEFSVPARIDDAWKVILQGQARRIDLPKVELQQSLMTEANSGKTTLSVAQSPVLPASRFFAQMAGAGFDARAVELVSWQLKKKFGYLAYVIACLQALQSSRSQIQVRVGQTVLTGEMVLFGNGRYYGGPHTVFPNASVDDGWLEVVVFPRITWGVALHCLWRFLLRRVPPHAGTHCLKAESVGLTSSSVTPFEVDGEAIGHLPATVTVLPKALRLIVPN